MVLVCDRSHEGMDGALYIEEMVDSLVKVSAQSCGLLHDFDKEQVYNVKEVGSGIEEDRLVLVSEGDGKMVLGGDSAYDDTDLVADTMVLHDTVFRVHNVVDIHTQGYVLWHLYEMLLHSDDELAYVLIDAGMGIHVHEEVSLQAVSGEHYKELSVQPACNVVNQHVVLHMKNELVLSG